MTTSQTPTKKGRTGSFQAPGATLTNTLETTNMSTTIISQATKTVSCLAGCEYAAERVRDDATGDGHTCQVTAATIEAAGPIGNTVTIAVSVVRWDGDGVVEPAHIEFGPVGIDPVGKLNADQADAMSAAFAAVAARLRESA